MTITNPLIKRLLVVFSEPESPNPEAFLTEYQTLVAKFSNEVLERAGDALIRTGGGKWPTPKKLVDACVKAEESLIARNSAALTKERPKWPWEIQAEQSREWAERYMAINPLADQARREGWSRELKGYVTSFAREALRAGHTPPEPIKYRPPPGQIAYYRSTFGGIGRTSA